MDTFTWIPSTANKKKAPRVLSSKFGDGYEQRIADGINNNPKTWDLQFTGRTDAEASAIDTFLSTQDGVSAFYWTDRDGQTLTYLCRTWNNNQTEPNVNALTATFEQVYV